MATIIRVENLSKKYIIGHQEQERYLTLRDTLGLKLKEFRTRLLHPFLSSSGQPLTGLSNTEDFWALKDISIEINEGDRLGIIGRNGAGKTTLLKILSRITEPTTGRISLKGRVASLLEVGTGFHPELTGRENVFLNGAVLGMTRAEIKKKFNEIIAFAGVDRFLDTPVKRYSSGMYVRLAFAVAAHLDPEILFVDEVLAVGDKAFQEKCLNKMDDVARRGRTVLFVSHNMAAISSLCNRTILLEDGKLVKDGATAEVVHAYLNRERSVFSQKVWSEKERPGNRSFLLVSVSLKNASGALVNEVNISEETAVEIEYEVIEEETQAKFSVVLFDANGYCVFSSLSNTENNSHSKGLKQGSYLSICTLYRDLLNNGRYHVSIIGTSDYWRQDFRVDHVISFEAVDDGVLKGDYPGSYGGAVRPRLNWKTVSLSTNV